MSEAITVILEDGANRHLIEAAIEQIKGVRSVGASDYEQARSVVVEALQEALRALDGRFKASKGGTP